MRKMNIAVIALLLLVGSITSANAMHITEGILPAKWAGLWFVLAVPFVALGLRQMVKKKQIDPSYIPLVGIFGAAVFVFSCFPIPVPVAGSTSHPAGTGLSAIVLGPLPSVVIAFVSLLLQALFLAHGGLTTLGANSFTMGVIGSFAGYAAFYLVRKGGGTLFWGGFAAGVVADLSTYFGTSFVMALALHGDHPFWSVLGQIYIAFMPTQIPLCLLEGAVGGMILSYVARQRPDLLKRQGLLKVSS